MTTTQTPIRESLYTDHLPTCDGEALWHELLTPITTPQRLHRTPTVGRVDAWLYGDMLISEAQASPQRTVRNRRQLAAGPLPAYNLLFVLEGRMRYEDGRRDRTLQPGDLLIEDLTEKRTITTPTYSRSINLMVPREGLDEGLHGSILERHSAPARLLSRHVHALLESLPTLHARHCDDTLKTLQRLIAACAGDGDVQSRRQIRRTLRDDIERFIERHLFDTRLGNASLCRHYRLSRTQLYRLFRQQGGIKEVILRKRLDWVHDQLCRGEGGAKPDTETLALMCGFASGKALETAYRGYFSVSMEDTWHADTASFPTTSRQGLTRLFSRLGQFPHTPT
ncbi:hypothetical protein [Billgrantia gudaonensis]|uniref:Transcriptional regulator, AraC family n=1 Tax=Billgrantia gudaonensis TaxID=376427 RepID=A0A1G8T7Q2_9GAMM|nr:hypothetical protein [Halomonas gudaonensis]SDJ36710.1 transcriptional regulator, AraC family [Halomonas gudaonensis]